MKVLLVLSVAILAGCGGVKSDKCMPAASGQCNMVSQCGCPEGEWCTWFPDTERCRTHETCTGLEPGTLEVGDDCSGDGRCRPGATCNPPGVDIPDVCLEWCQENSDCSEAGATCTIEASYDIPGCEHPVTLPYRLCSRAM